MDTKDQRALEALLALAFRQELTEEEIVRLFDEPVVLSKEDKAVLENINIEEIIKNGIYNQGSG